MGWACIWDPGSDIWIQKNLRIDAGVKKAQIPICKSGKILAIISLFTPCRLLLFLKIRVEDLDPDPY